MLTPGVRGGNGFHYSNLVMFRPTDWKLWVDQTIEPQEFNGPCNCEYEPT
jgi:hypothetical protein